jgi:hypothetical protein
MELKIEESSPIQLIVRTPLLVARAKKQASKPKKAGRNPPGYVSANRCGGKGIPPRAETTGARNGKRRITAFFGEANAFWPGHGVIWPWEATFIHRTHWKYILFRKKPVFLFKIGDDSKKGGEQRKELSVFAGALCAPANLVGKKVTFSIADCARSAVS